MLGRRRPGNGLRTEDFARLRDANSPSHEINCIRGVFNPAFGGSLIDTLLSPGSGFARSAEKTPQIESQQELRKTQAAAGGWLRFRTERSHAKTTNANGGPVRPDLVSRPVSAVNLQTGRLGSSRGIFALPDIHRRQKGSFGTVTVKVCPVRTG